MTKYLSRIALAAVVALVGCSGDSPTPSNPAPPGGNQATWAITSLTLSDSQPFVGSVVTITATVTKDGNPAPDGTTVEFTALNTGVDPLLKATEGGVAAFGFTSGTEGSFTIQARVNTASRTVAVTFVERAESDTFVITPPLMPDQGAYGGNEQVIISGKAIASPVEVDFIVGGITFPAEIVAVNESEPIEASGSITIRTPHITDVDRTESSQATVVVRVGVNTGNEQSAQLPAGFTYLAETELWIYQPFDPNTGAYDGGENITLRGRGITAPAEVVFTLRDQPFAGIVQEVVESIPSSADGSIVVQTPYIPQDYRVDGDNEIIDQVVDVTVTVRADHADAQTMTVPSAFTFTTQGSELRPYWDLDEPSFYLVLPDYGASSGGETVTILGRNFRALYMDTDGATVLETAPAVKSVTFGGVEGVVQAVSADGTQATVMTPRYSTLPLTEDTPVNVVVTTEYAAADLGPFTASITNGYVFLADEPTPVITALAPTGGPVDGGTRVTIFGSGFQVPAQVTFGVLEATGVEVHDDQSLADQDTIVCISPDYSQQGATIPLAVDVVVRNVLTGKVSEPETFTYGDNLYISDNTPTQGGPGTNIIIYGAGFEDPLTVEFTSGVLAGNRLEELSVSGTELLVRVPVDTPPVCASTSTSFTVTLLESGRVATGGTFTYLGNTPQIFGVDPIFVDEDGGVPMTITGDFFSPDLIVEINGYRLNSELVDVPDENTIYVDQVPTFELIGATWDTVSCVDDVSGMPGVRIVPTPVDLAVVNLPGNCRDTLSGGLVYEPGESICFVGLMIEPTPFDFDTFAPAGPTSVGGIKGPVDFTVTNNGSVTVNMLSATIDHPAFVITAGGGFQQIAPGADTTISVQFMPTEDDIVGGEDTLLEGVLSVVSGGSGLPQLTTVADLRGTVDAAPSIAVSPDVLDIYADPGGNNTESVTVTNDGTATLNYTASLSGDAEFSITLGASGMLSPGASAQIDILFDASAAASGAVFNTTLTVTDPASANTGSVTINGFVN